MCWASRRGMAALYFQFLWVAGVCTAILSAQSGFDVVTNPDGSYKITVNGQVWLNSAATFFQNDGKLQTTADGSLKLQGPPELSTGADKLGDWNKATYWYNLYQATAGCSIRRYKLQSVAVFSQLMEGADARDTAVGDPNKVVSAFPSFHVEDSNNSIGYLALGGNFIGDYSKVIGQWKPGMKFSDGLEGGPVVLFDKLGHVIIISPFNQFMAASMSHDQKMNTVNWGIMGNVNSLPKGFMYETILFYGDRGLNQAMSAWGELMRFWYNKDPHVKDHDPTIAYIGYYTDNGAYYYHKTEPGMNYEDTMLGIYNDAMKKMIPYRYLQYDDWWYPIKGTGYGATVTWDAMPSIFPHGLQFLYEKTNMPVVAHNRYWSNATTYAKQNGGQFEFYMDGENSLPLEERFWDWLFGWAVKWGMIVYEQDWLDFQVNHLHALQEDLYLGRRWLMGMGEAADHHGVFLQYCMSLTRHALQSLEIPKVTQARASIDYHVQKDQWKIGISSIFADALGIAPFKDNFWTNPKQPGNPYNTTEPYVLLEAAVAVLSTGPVGISDRIGLTNLSIINQLIRADGMILKPSKPAMAIDAQFIQTAFGGDLGPQGEVWSTYSEIGRLRFGIIFASDLMGHYKIGPTQAGFIRGFSPDQRVYSYRFTPYQSHPQVFSDNNPLYLQGCTKDDFCLYYTTPVLQWGNITSVCVLGELFHPTSVSGHGNHDSKYSPSKLVPISPQRTTDISWGEDDFQVSLTGAPNETFYYWLHLSDKYWYPFHCVINEGGTATLSFRYRTCR